MHPSCHRVLSMLRRHKKGITFDVFPVGFRLGARIYELRKAGHDIITLKKPLGPDCVRACYVLQSKRQSDIRGQPE